jgi:hypothetical protein
MKLLPILLLFIGIYGCSLFKHHTNNDDPAIGQIYSDNDDTSFPEEDIKDLPPSDLQDQGNQPPGDDTTPIDNEEYEI